MRIPKPIQAMIVLAALPQKWEVLVPIITQTVELDKLDISDVREAILAQYQTESAHRPHNNGNNKNNKQHNANKLSAVKRKRGDPSFSNQQRGDNQSQQSGDKPRQRGQRGKGKGKGKGKPQSDGHNHAHISHVADIASLGAPTMSTIAQISPSGVQKRTVSTPAPKERTPGPYKSLNQALDLADRIGVTPTIQTTKTLEQRLDSPAAVYGWSVVQIH